MVRFVWLLVSGWLSLVALALPVAAQPTADLTIVVSGNSTRAAAPWGVLLNVPAEATAASVTVTLSDGSTRTVTTSAAQDWRFTFSPLQTSATGPWIQVEALASTGMGASRRNDAIAAAGPWLPETLSP